MLCFIALKELQDAVEEAQAKGIRSTLILAVKCVADQTKGFYMAQGVLRSVYAQMQLREFVLFKQHSNFIDVENPKIVAQRLKHIQSNWPLSALSFAEDPQERRSWNVIESADD